MIFSDQPERREKERAAYIYFMDYVEDCEGIYANFVTILFWEGGWYCLTFIV